MKSFNDTVADSLAATSGISAVIHFATQIQPIVSTAAAFAAFFSGMMAGIYYGIKAYKNLRR